MGEGRVAAMGDRQHKAGKALILDFKSPEASELQHKVSVWRGFTLEHSALPLPAVYDFKGTNAGHHYLAYHNLVLNEGEMAIEGAPSVRGGDLRGKMTYIPSGRVFHGWAKPKDRTNSFTTLTFRPGLISEELELLFAGTQEDPAVYFQNEPLKATMLKLESALKSNLSPSALYLETLGLAAVLEMNMALSAGGTPPLRHGGLGKSQVNQLSEYIRVNLTRNMTLEELAGLVGMSRFHFSRSFKQAFGDSPVRYVNRERYRLAQALLAGSRLSVAEIAARVGFGSTQQFLKVFRTLAGMTPAEFRKQA